MMSEKLKTIKELADELGVSKQNLQYHVKFLPTKKRQKNNDVFAFNNHLLKEIIDLKEVNKQLLESQKQTQNLLDQQQRLALQDKKLLEEYKAENARINIDGIRFEADLKGENPILDQFINVKDVCLGSIIR